MPVAITMLVGVAATVASVGLAFAIGADANSFPFLVFWTGAPYLGYCGLALLRGRRREASVAICFATAFSGGLATLIYWSSNWEFIQARSRGEGPLDCGGPLVELGFPLIQWVSVGVLWIAMRPVRSPAPPAHGAGPPGVGNA
jgi:hypothetical protein